MSDSGLREGEVYPSCRHTHASVRRALQGLADRLRELAP